MPRLAPILTLLAGCGPGLTSLNPDGSDTEVPGSVLRIDEIVPDRGPTTGGTEVEIVGQGFQGDVVLKFGRAEVPVEVFGDGRLTAVSPEAGIEVTVDVTVTSSLGEFVLSGGYTFTDDPVDTGDTGNPDDTGDTADTGDTGSDPRPTGQIGGFAQLVRTQVACPDCFGLTSGVFLDGTAVFHAPTRDRWLDWIPAVGSCVANPNGAGPSVGYQDAGEWVYFQSGSANLPMRKVSDTAGVYYSAALDPAAYLSNASFSVSVPGGGALGRPFEVRDLFRTPQGFTDVQPSDLLITDSSWAFSAEISESYPAFTWAPSGGSGTFVVVVDIYDGWDGTYLGQVYCHGPDNGRMILPSSAFGPYPYYSLLAVGLYRTWIDDGVVPPTGHTIEALAQSGVLGTGVLVP